MERAKALDNLIEVTLAEYDEEQRLALAKRREHMRVDHILSLGGVAIEEVIHGNASPTASTD